MKNDKLTSAINNELEALQNKMKDTIKEEEERGMDLHILDKRTKKLDERAQVFEEHAEETEWKMWFKVVKWYVLIGGILILVLVAIFYR